MKYFTTCNGYNLIRRLDIADAPATQPTSADVDNILTNLCGAVLARDMEASAEACNVVRRWLGY